jgi:hypothetical protein
MTKSVNTFLIFSEYAELLDLALYLQNVEKQEVFMHIPSKEHNKIGEGMVEKVKDWYTCLGKGYVWVFDGCSSGKLQDWLRSEGEMVFGGTEKSDELENNRQAGQRWFKSAGFKQPISKNFKGDSAFQDALDYIKQNS